VNTATSDYPAGTRGYPAGDLRVSDADRDRALAELSEHFQAGRLTTEELEERSGRALQARTGTDLAVLLADLPPSQAPVPLAEGQGAIDRRRPGRVPVLRIVIVAVAISAVISAVSGGRGGHHDLVALVPIAAVLLMLRTRVCCGVRKRDRR
jgi:Domain of unknown function (DUF1707)